jgi:hypothetical protein
VTAQELRAVLDAHAAHVEANRAEYEESRGDYHPSADETLAATRALLALDDADLVANCRSWLGKAGAGWWVMHEAFWGVRS